MKKQKCWPAAVQEKRDVVCSISDHVISRPNSSRDAFVASSTAALQKSLATMIATQLADIECFSPRWIGSNSSRSNVVS
jgi:hypothetical protein